MTEHHTFCPMIYVSVRQPQIVRTECPAATGNKFQTLLGDNFFICWITLHQLKLV